MHLISRSVSDGLEYGLKHYDGKGNGGKYFGWIRCELPLSFLLDEEIRTWTVAPRSSI